MCMILIGLCAYNRLRLHWSLARTVSCAGVCLAAMTASSWFIDDGDAFRLPKFIGYVVAVVSFALAYAYRDQFRSNGVIRHLADMSFSLYVVHFVLGMVVMDLLVRATDRPLVSTVAALVVVVAVSMALHRYVEAPGIRIGKRWATRPVKKPVG
jgi:peptidoglycan/LPS O-acetylase OafA/YrhL